MEGQTGLRLFAGRSLLTVMRRVTRRRVGYKQSQRDGASVKTGRADPLGASRGSKSHPTEQGGWNVRKILHYPNEEHYSLPPISLYRPHERCSRTTVGVQLQEVMEWR